MHQRIFIRKIERVILAPLFLLLRYSETLVVFILKLYKIGLMLVRIILIILFVGLILKVTFIIILFIIILVPLRSHGEIGGVSTDELWDILINHSI